jgi:hypothetical protein
VSNASAPLTGKPYATPQLLFLTARTGPALVELARKYEQFLSEKPELDLADVCYSANTGRAHFEHRLAAVAEDLPEAREPDDIFVAELTRRFNGMSPLILQDPELMKLLLPTLRADITALGHLKPMSIMMILDCPMSDCPICAFGGSFDATTTEDELRAWRLHTHNSFELKVFQGDHFYLFLSRFQLAFKSRAARVECNQGTADKPFHSALPTG